MERYGEQRASILRNIASCNTRNKIEELYEPEGDSCVLYLIV